METLLTPEGGLAGLFVASFLAATVVPFSSEAVLFGYLKLHPQHAALAVALATAGNTLGGMTTYLIGRLLPQRNPDSRALRWLQRYGAPATLLAWLPVVGDALCAAAGWLRVNWLAVLGFMAVGRLARYLVIAALA
ncbi:MAG: DedA family protein [Proteobacteria bacterium]|nr:DedA family protein [Pseudomonadota bacterium]